MDNNKDSWVREEIFRILFNLSGSYLKYAQGDLQLKGASGLKMIDYFYNLKNDLAKLENSAIKLSVKQQDLIKNCYAIIKQETKLILEEIESNLQTLEFTLESPEQYQEKKETLSKLLKDYDTIIADGITFKEQLTQKKEILFELKEDVMELCSIPELQELQLQEPERESTLEAISKEFNINNFILSMQKLNDDISRIHKIKKLIESSIGTLKYLGSMASVQQQEIMKNDYEIIKKDIENILQLIEYNLQVVEFMLKAPEEYKESKENLSKLIKDYDTIIENKTKLKEQRIQKKETLCKLKEGVMQLCSIRELQELQLEEDNIKSTSALRATPFYTSNFISDIKNLLSKEQIYYYKQSAKDAGLSVTEFNNFILTSLIPELNDNISRISNQEELNEDQKKDVEDLTNYITSFKEGLLNENRNQSINTTSDPTLVQKKKDNTNSQKQGMCRIL